MTIEIKKSPYAVGIDLGTSNSSISVYHKGDPKTLMLNGAKAIPSVVQFRGRKKEQLMVGKSAKQNILLSPDEIFSSVKFLMKNDDWKNDPAVADKFHDIDPLLEPTDVASEILKKIMAEVNTQTDFDFNGTIQNAVICVPANTTDTYRNNVYQAALKAGIGELDDNGEVITDALGRPKGVSLLDEPTAAAIAYGHELGLFSQEKKQTIMVYDLGGGTFDVSILQVDSATEDIPVFRVLNTKGVSRLGGDDFDQCIMDIAAHNFKDASGIDIFDFKSDQGGISGRALKEAQKKLKERAEEIKIAFSSGTSREELEISNFLTDGDGTAHSLELVIEKTAYLESIQPLLEQANECVRQTLDEIQLGLDEINRVILVGGSTKAPWVREAIQSLYPTGQERKPYDAREVDVIVSQGAAIYGSSRPVDSDEKIEVIGQLNHHLGIEVKGQVFGLILEKGLPLDDGESQAATKVYGTQTNQDSMQIIVWKTQKTIEMEGEGAERNPVDRHYITECDKNGERIFECIGEFNLSGIPKAREGMERVEITMEIHPDKTLNVTAKVLSSGDQKEASLSVNKS